MKTETPTWLVDEVVAENKRRHEKLIQPYNPVTGLNCQGERISVSLSDAPIPTQYLPCTMLQEQDWVKMLAEAGSIDNFIRLNMKQKPTPALRDSVWCCWLQQRIRHDFEFWASMYLKIKDKRSQFDIPFVLNRPQRRLLDMFEQMRLANEPIRLIMLKARQWGGSTLTQLYMAWIQLVHRSNWNSVICAHLKDVSSQIKGMYTKVLDNYPAWLLNSDIQPKFSPFERAANTSYIPQTGSKVTICSAESPDIVRGSDAAMAHLSEAAFWSNTPARTPEALIRAVCGSIALLPYSMVVIESTANGTGGYFHREYLRARRGESDKRAIFVPWYEIEMYSLTVNNPRAFAASLNDYERHLWQLGATLEAIAWYRTKRKEYSDDADMMAEYPSDDTEAFAHSGERVFSIEAVNRLRAGCCPPFMVGDIKALGITGRDALRKIDFEEEPHGLLRVWSLPQKGTPMRYRYIVVVDIGGRSHKADYSVIAVFDRIAMLSGGAPEVVAQWRGHIDHDLLAWKATQIATFYNNALLVVESNTLETEVNDEMPAGYILDIIAENYNHLYARRHEGGEIGGNTPVRWGFHMNRTTKQLVVHHQINVLRNNAYIEREADACDEYDVYERHPNGSFGAKEGYHDDILITRCIGTYICSNESVTSPALGYHRTPPPISEASF